MLLTRDAAFHAGDLVCLLHVKRQMSRRIFLIQI